MGQLQTGKVKTYKPEAGWGFITKDSGGDLFFHTSGLSQPLAKGKMIPIGTLVNFEEGANPKKQGQLIAVNIDLLR